MSFVCSMMFLFGTITPSFHTSVCFFNFIFLLSTIGYLCCLETQLSLCAFSVKGYFIKEVYIQIVLREERYLSILIQWEQK